MDRRIVYPGQQVLDTDTLQTQRHLQLAVSMLSQLLFGSATGCFGLPCTPGTGLQVSVGAGQMYSMLPLDATAFGSLSSDTTHSLLKQGVNLDPVLFALAAPGTVGQSINYLIEAQVQETDVSLNVVPFYNAANPPVAWSGPGNSGNPVAQRRQVAIALQAKAGTAATTGSQTTPTADAGWTGLWIVTVNHGDTSILSGAISMVSGAPFLGQTLIGLEQAFGGQKLISQGKLYFVGTR